MESYREMNTFLEMEETIKLIFNLMEGICF